MRFSLPLVDMTGTYDPRLVALSIIIAIFASYAALDLTGRITASHRKARLFWLFGGATAMGLGIWSMHYIGMLAYRMPMKILYDMPTVVLSLLAAIAASAVALFTVSRRHMGLLQTLVGGVVMGSGIAAMHYIGMAAMRIPATVGYSRPLVLLSIVLAVTISLVALVLAFQIREESRTSPRKIASAFVMGSAIPIMHYTGMWAARFTPSETSVDVSRAVSISSLGIAVVSASTLLILSLVIVSAFLDRSLSAQKALTETARKAELYFRTLAEAIPTIIWTARADGYFDFYNRRWHDYAGRDSEQSIGDGWQSVLHPDDLSTSAQKWRHAVASGEPYEVEYRLRRALDGSYRWHLARALPVRNPDGVIAKWFGTCTDIDDQKRNQHTLEEEVRRRTEELLEANSRLTQEMAERERTQERLNRQTAQLVEELTERSQKAALLAKMGELLQSCNTAQEAFSIVLGFAPKMFSDLGGAIILLNASKNLLEVVGAWDPCQLSASVFEPTSCWALRTGHRYLVAAGDRSAPCAHANEVQGAYLCIPIQAHGDALGVIHFQATDASQITEQELSLSGTFAEQIGLSIANIRLREALRNQSIRDSVTGLFNRRYLEETLEREVHRCIRTGQSLGVIMLDLDRFKSFNDTFGHDAGDVVLHSVGVFLSKNTRADDIACRYGGEEFVLILPNANLHATESRAEELREAAKQLNITHLGKPLGAVTFSAGVATFPQHGSSAAQLMAKADGALYQAKKNGRDRVVVADRSGIEVLAGVGPAGNIEK
jgi:diguanylate cyclase (GGDEF)-like protein/PAS domain S-box-containing protein